MAEDYSKNIADWVTVDFVSKEVERRYNPDFNGGEVILHKHSPHLITVGFEDDLGFMLDVLNHEIIHCILFELFWPDGGDLSSQFDNTLASYYMKNNLDKWVKPQR